MVAKQRDAPLELIEARRGGDELHDAASKGAATLAVVLHQLDTLFVRQGEPVGALLASLRHRVETERVLALGEEAPDTNVAAASRQACSSRIR